MLLDTYIQIVEIGQITCQNICFHFTEVVNGIVNTQVHCSSVWSFSDIPHMQQYSCRDTAIIIM